MHLSIGSVFLLFWTFFFLSFSCFFAATDVHAYGWTDEPCTTLADIVVPDDNSNLTNAIQNNTNSTILVKSTGSPYTATGYNIGNGNIVKPYGCQQVEINFTGTNDASTDNWTLAGFWRLDWGNLDNGGLRLGPGASGITVRNNHIIGHYPTELTADVRNVTFEGNTLEACPNCTISQGVKLDDNSTSTSGPVNILFYRNDFIGNAATYTAPDIHDMIAVEGLVNTGANLQSVLKPSLGNFSLVFRQNRFHALAYPNGRIGENMFDIKIAIQPPSLAGRVLWEQNWMKGPFPGGQQIEQSGRCINFGDACLLGEACPEHVATHNFSSDCRAPFETPVSEQRSEAYAGGGSRYMKARMEFNAINNHSSGRLDVGGMNTPTGVVFIKNSYFNDVVRISGPACTDALSTGFIYAQHKNIFVGTLVTESCSSGTVDWVLNNNIYWSTQGNNMQSYWGANSGNSSTINPGWINVSNNGSRLLNNDFTVTSTAVNNGIPVNSLGAFPVPVVTGATIQNDCIVRVTMTDNGETTNLGYTHMPMSAIDVSKITEVLYNGVAQPLPTTGSVSGNTVQFTMASCPATGQTVTFDANAGWCRDSANIGDILNIKLTGGCAAVSNRAVTNNSTGGAVDTTPPVVNITSPVGGAGGSFPTSAVLDNFNRAGPALGANWTADIGATNTGCLITSNKVGTPTCANRWAPATFSAPLEVHMDYENTASTGQALNLMACLQGAITGLVDGYKLKVRRTASNLTWEVFRVDDDLETQIGADFDQVLTAVTWPVKAGMSIDASGNFTVYSGSTTLFTRGPDTTYSCSADPIGIIMNGTDNTADNFGGGAGASRPVLTGVGAITATCTDNIAVSHVCFSVDGTQLPGGCDFASPFTFNMVSNYFNNGPNFNLEAKCFDSTGNSATANVSFDINNPADVTNPVVTITNLTDGQAVAGDITINATCTDNIACSQVEFQINGQPLFLDVSAPFVRTTYSGAWNTATTSQGLVVITAIGTDYDGRTHTDTVSVQVAEQILPTDDAYICNEPAMCGEGDTITLFVRNNGQLDFRSLLKYDVTALAGLSIATAELQANVVGLSGNGLVISAYGADDTPWTESSVNWSNAPVLGTLQDALGVTTLGVKSWDVSAEVAAAVAGDGILTLYLIDNAADGDGVHIDATESTFQPPVLVITEGP